MGQDAGDLNAKTKRGGTDSRVYATQHAPQTCPVQDYKEYAQRRPPAMRYEDAPFYLSIKPVVNLAALHCTTARPRQEQAGQDGEDQARRGTSQAGRPTSVYQSCSTLSEAQSNQRCLSVTIEPAGCPVSGGALQQWQFHCLCLLVTRPSDTA